MLDDSTAIDQIYSDDDAPEGPVSAYKQLRPVERLFVDAYISDLQSSAVAAGQKVIDYVRETNTGSRLQQYDARNKSAAHNARQMMQKPLVRAAITERVNELTEKFEINAYKVLREVANIAMASMGDYMDVSGGSPVFDLTKCTPEQLAAIKSVKIKETPLGTRTFEFELHPKMTALDMLMKYMGLYGEDNSQRNVVPTANAPAQQITTGQTTEVAADLYARTLRRGTA